jgi:hypothetical protein
VSLVQRRVVCAALRNESGQIIIGVRHFDEFMRQDSLKLALQEASKHEAGRLEQVGQDRP